MSEYTAIAAFNQLPPATELALHLENAGIPAEVFNESAEQRIHLFQPDPHAQFRVRVPTPELDRALAQLRDWEGHDEALAQAVHCPECGSTLVEYPQFSRRTIVGALPALAAAVGIIERDYYCESCHFTWPAEKEPPQPELDRLNWPKK